MERLYITAKKTGASNSLDNNDVCYLIAEISPTSESNVYIDDLQLEKKSSCSSYNYVQNGLFEYFNNGLSTKKWLTSNNYSINSASINGNDYQSITFAPGMDQNNAVSQTIAFNGHRGNTITFGGWMKGNIINCSSILYYRQLFGDEGFDNEFYFPNNRHARIKIEYTYTNENTETQTAIEYIDFDQYITDWQYSSKSITLQGECSSITISVESKNNANPVSFSGVNLSVNDDSENSIIENIETGIISESPPETGYYYFCEREPNDTSDIANSMMYKLYSNSLYEIIGDLNFQSENDIDYYNITTSESGSLSIQAVWEESSFRGNENYLSIDLYDQNDSLISSSTYINYNNYSSQKILANLPVGNYKVAVHSTSNFNNLYSSQGYRLSLSIQN